MKNLGRICQRLLIKKRSEDFIFDIVGAFNMALLPGRRIDND